MRRILYVAEKNDVAKGIAGILSRGTMQRREGRSKYNKIYQLQMDFQGQPASIAVTSVSGHLMNLDFGPEMKQWESDTIGALFDAPVYSFVSQNMTDIARTLKEESSKADTLVVWTDCDREGENIGAEIVRVCQQANRNLDVYRARFSEITAAAIHRAAHNLVRLDQRIVDAVDCRSELDLRIGAAFTRLQTLHLQKRASLLLGDNKQVVSYGSCQFPTLGFVVERYKEIEQFIPESFFKLEVEVTRDGQKVAFLWQRGRLFDRDVVNALFDDCAEAKIATIEDITRRPSKKFRPVALDTVEMEKLAVRKLKLSAKQAMGIAEKLYSQGWISYPRTETNKFPPDLDLKRLVEMQAADEDWGEFAAEIVEKGTNPRNGSKSDEAHPPIHPLKFASRTQLQGNEWRVYELVVRHFLACVSWDASGHQTKITLSLGAEQFVASGLEVADLGYLRVYPYEKWSEKSLPAFTEGEQLSDCNLRILDGSTTAPPLLNEADLIVLMDKFGIGTDATHAEHIEKIKERKYVGVQGDGRFLPGYLGLALVDAYDQMGYALSKPQLRADLEKQLEAICEGRRSKLEVLAEQCAKYRTIFSQTAASINLLSATLSRYVNSNLPMPDNSRPANGPSNRAANVGTAVAASRGRPNVVQVPPHAIPTAQRGTRGRPRGSRGVGGSRGGAAPSRAAAAPPVVNNAKLCRCGQASVQRTVNKEGPNKGRKFWTCAKPMGSNEKCNYFEWAT